MTTHDFALKIKPLWKALCDIEDIASEMVSMDRTGRALKILQIANDTRSHFSSEEQRIVDGLLAEIKHDPMM